jgi:signal transduction histidine kinase
LDVARRSRCSLVPIGSFDEATVKLEQRDGQLRIEVHDSGAGFDLLAAAMASFQSDNSSKFGLFSIHERMAVGRRESV